MHPRNPIDIEAERSGEPVFREVGVGPWADARPGEPRPDDPASPLYADRFRYDPALLDEGDRRNVLDRYRYWTVAAIKADLDARGRHDFEVAIENWTHDFNIGSMVRTANAFQARRVHIVGPHKWNRNGALMTELYQHMEHHPSIAELVECWRNRIAGEIAAERARASAAAFHAHEAARGADAPAMAGSAHAGSAVSGPDIAASDAVPVSGLAVDAAARGSRDSLRAQTAFLAELDAADARIRELEAARVIAMDIIPGAVPMETYAFPKRCLLLFGAEGPGLTRTALDLADDVVYISQFGSVRSINAGAAAAVTMHAWITQHAAIG
ncbi:RNA methyltransferase [Bifidobacterium sp. MA2]|uniref:RNA methyltransferase n=1 Tax=Bifidobacterium santillanense TaxID=2809028 RepID=A0ABS5UQU1_9BIFI|nr:TrmH family RNA methyltransferase [Bifidobacterium santillanense]MBT1173267.1 RNA methyltransferase [Bifidobacterium santillanense]